MSKCKEETHFLAVRLCSRKMTENRALWLLCKWQSIWCICFRIFKTSKLIRDKSIETLHSVQQLIKKTTPGKKERRRAIRIHEYYGSRQESQGSNVAWRAENTTSSTTQMQHTGLSSHFRHNKREVQGQSPWADSDQRTGNLLSILRDVSAARGSSRGTTTFLLGLSQSVYSITIHLLEAVVIELLESSSSSSELLSSSSRRKNILAELKL